MKILFDISTRGAAANAHQRGTIGIFRVIEHNARALAVAPVVETWFYANQNRKESQRYFEQALSPDALSGSNARFAAPDLPGGKLVENAVTAADDFLSRHYPYRPWNWLASGRIIWRGVRTLLRGVEPAAARGLNIYHTPTGPFPAWTAQAENLLRFITIYDLMPIIHPEFTGEDAARHLRRTLGTITPQDWTLSISEWTRRDLLAHCPACNPARALVVPLAADASFHPETDPARLAAVRARYGIPADAPYFLSVSTLEPRKNFETVIRAFARFVAAAPDQPSALVLTGGKIRPDSRTILEVVESQPENVRDRIVYTGFVAEEDLAALYAGGLAFLYLSFYEGFGLPPLEAMQCGLPVIASNASSLPEVVGDGGILIAPNDVEAASEHMRAIYRDQNFRGELASRGLARAQAFSWEHFAQQTLAAYQQALLSQPTGK